MQRTLAFQGDMTHLLFPYAAKSVDAGGRSWFNVTVEGSTIEVMVRVGRLACPRC